MDLHLLGKRAIVTASSRGLGFACAQALAGEGVQVMVASREEARAKQAADNINETCERQDNKGKAYAGQVDVSSRASLETFFAHSTDILGGLDVLVCNAGGPPAGSFGDLDEASWDAAYQLTLQSVIRSVRLALPHFIEAGGGVIVVITSSSVKSPIPNLLLSNVFRPAVQALCKSLAIELAEHNVRVLNVAPGRIDTDRIRELDTARAVVEGSSYESIRQASQAAIPLKRLGTPAEFANVVAFLCSEVAGYVTGSTIFVDGGTVMCL